MSRFASANLINVFDFYLAAVAVLSFARRYTVYWDVVRLMIALRGRWPRLVERLRQHHGVLVTRQVILPTALALVLMLVQLVCSRVIWPHAALTAGEVAAEWWRLLAIVSAAVPMLLVDGYFLVSVGRFDRGETEKYLDMAENWLTGWKGHAVRVATFGYVNPHRMVDDEVKKNLATLGETVSWSMWWVTAQIGCRVAFGIALWLVWAVG